MKISERNIHSSIIIERKDGKLTLSYPEYGFKDTFDNENEAIETVIYSAVELLQQTNFNMRDAMNEKFDKLELIINTCVKSEIN